MGIASAMKELTQDIASSHRDRVNRVGEIKEEAKEVRAEAEDLMKGFQASRKRAGVQLRRDLSQESARRKSEVKRMLADAQGLVEGFQASRREEGTQMRKELAQGVAERRSEVNKTMAEAQRTIKGLRSQRKSTGAKLRKELVQSRASNESEVAELREDAENLIKEFQGSRIGTADKLREDLAEGRAERESEVNKMRNDFRRAQAGVRAELKEAAAAWQALAKPTQAKRVGVKVRPKVKLSVAEKERSEVPVAEEEMPDLEGKLLAAISVRPGGITLAEVAGRLGVFPIVLGRASRSLLEKGKIRKKDRLYFPVVSG